MIRDFVDISSITKTYRLSASISFFHLKQYHEDVFDVVFRVLHPPRSRASALRDTSSEIETTGDVEYQSIEDSSKYFDSDENVSDAIGLRLGGESVGESDQEKTLTQMSTSPSCSIMDPCMESSALALANRSSTQHVDYPSPEPTISLDLTRYMPANYLDQFQRSGGLNITGIEAGSSDADGYSDGDLEDLKEKPWNIRDEDIAFHTETKVHDDDSAEIPDASSKCKVEENAEVGMEGYKDYVSWMASGSPNAIKEEDLDLSAQYISECFTSE